MTPTFFLVLFHVSISLGLTSSGPVALTDAGVTLQAVWKYVGTLRFSQRWGRGTELTFNGRDLGCQTSVMGGAVVQSKELSCFCIL